MYTVFHTVSMDNTVSLPVVVTNFNAFVASTNKTAIRYTVR